MVALSVYTDGSSSRDALNCGGWAYCVVQGTRMLWAASEGVTETSNNRMELTAAIKSLGYVAKSALLRPGEGLELVSDSQYVVNYLAEDLRYAWAHLTDWKNAVGQDIANRDLWEHLEEVLCRLEARRIKVTFRWVRGHNGDRFNEHCDTLAVQAKKKLQLALGVAPAEKRPRKSVGSATPAVTPGKSGRTRFVSPIASGATTPSRGALSSPYR